MDNKALLLFTIIGMMLLLSADAVRAQRNQDVCAVFTHQRSIKEGGGTGNYLVGKFPVDDIEAITAKKYREERDGLPFLITVEIEYGDFRAVEKKKPTYISLTLTVVPESKQAAAYNGETVTARMNYRDMWGYLELEKELVVGATAYTFKLLCSDGISKESLKRNDPKPRKVTRKTSSEN